MERTGCTGWSLAIILTIIFIALQVTNVINWSWIWLISPLWIMIGLDILIFIIWILLILISKNKNYEC